ncbi:hypothetical protein HD554DRAFT_2042304 [Boletus coccyginus]|nr:hypothetical protein HD554DRAFT_2042304 [Boletus coccyginus]
MGGDIQNKPNIFPKEALDLLESRWPAWKEAKKEKGFEEMHGGSRPIVLEDQLKQQVIEKVKEQNEGNYIIQDYQPTLNELLDRVLLDKESEARQLVEEWNTTGDEMWKKGGVQMMIFAEWKDEKSDEIFSTVNDFNPEIKCFGPDDKDLINGSSGRKASGNPKIMVSFMKLFNSQSHHQIVDSKHMPFGWTIPRNLSKVVKKEAWKFLFHVQQCEEQYGEGAFRFKK